MFLCSILNDSELHKWNVCVCVCCAVCATANKSAYIYLLDKFYILQFYAEKLTDVPINNWHTVKQICYR